MSEVKTPIKTLNGHALVDTEARASIEELEQRHAEDLEKAMSDVTNEFENVRGNISELSEEIAPIIGGVITEKLPITHFALNDVGRAITVCTLPPNVSKVEAAAGYDFTFRDMATGRWWTGTSWEAGGAKKYTEYSGEVLKNYSVSVVVSHTDGKDATPEEAQEALTVTYYSEGGIPLSALSIGSRTYQEYNWEESGAALFGYPSGTSFAFSTGAMTAIIPAKANTEYTISLPTGMWSRFGLVIANGHPSTGGVLTDLNPGKTSDGGRDYATLITASDSQYILVFCYRKASDPNYTPAEIFASLLVTAGSEHKAYVPYYKMVVPTNQLPDQVQEFIEQANRTVINTRGLVYGVEIDNNVATTACTRIESAAGLKANYAVGAEMVEEHANDFDNVFPWGAIRRCCIDADGNLIYDGEDGFAVDGSAGNVFVEIPKFYVRREVEGSKERLYITGEKKSGFVVEPLFVSADGKENEYAYIAAYHTSGSAASVTDALPTVNTTMETFRVSAQKIGGGAYDYPAFMAIQHLVMVEFATRDVTNLFPGIGELPYYSDTSVAETASNTNTVLAKGRAVSKFRVGQRVCVSPDGSYIYEDREITAVSMVGNDCRVTFSGDPVSVTANTSRIYCVGQRSGGADGMTYHTGQAGETLVTAMRYRWMENLWGNVWMQCDGLRVKELEYYYTFDPAHYGDANISEWVKIGAYESVEQNQYPAYNAGWIKRMGYDRKHPLVALPAEIENQPLHYNGKLYTILDKNADGVSQPTDAEWVCVTGGGWDHALRNSPFTTRFWNTLATGNAGGLYGSRLVLRKDV